MKRTSKITTMLATLALSLSMTAGIVSAETTSLPVSVNLEREEALCDITFEADGTFGVWEWDGTAYVFVEGSNPNDDVASVFLYGYMNSMPSRGCDITVGFDGLSSQAGGTIGTENFSVHHWYTNQAEDPAGWSHAGVIGEPDGQGIPSYDWDIYLETVPADLQAGEYTGEIGITYSNAE